MGPLPRAYRAAIALATIAFCLAAGLVLAARAGVPQEGLLFGLLSGVVLAFVLVHDFQRPEPRPQRVRVRR